MRLWDLSVFGQACFAFIIRIGQVVSLDTEGFAMGSFPLPEGSASIPPIA